MVLLARRQLIAGALCAASQPAIALAAPAALPPSLRFAIMRKGKPFGSYQVAFAQAGKQLTVTTDVAMNQKIAGVQVFDYVHHCVEVWRDGKFAEMHSRTVRDRKDVDEVNAVRDAYEVKISTNKSPNVAPAGAAPLTHWNAATLTGPLFNPQDGRTLDLKANQVGRDPVLLANGSQLTAAHWALRGVQQIDEWYDNAGLWAGLKGVFPDKSVVEYRRI
jgi:hypothetical protein